MLEHRPIMVAYGVSSVQYTLGCVIVYLGIPRASGEIEGVCVQKLLIKDVKLGGSAGIFNLGFPGIVMPSWLPGIANMTHG